MRKIILTTAFAVALISGTSVIYFQGREEALRAKIVMANGQIMDQVQHRLEDNLAQVTEGLLDLGAERRNHSNELQAEIRDAQVTANRWAWAVAASLAGAALLSFTLTMTGRRRCLAAVALACWILGLTLPVLTLTVEAHVSSPIDLGKLLLREETKSLLGLLNSLWEKQNWLLVGLIGVFGIAVASHKNRVPIHWRQRTHDPCLCWVAGAVGTGRYCCCRSGRCLSREPRQPGNSCRFPAGVLVFFGERIDQHALTIACTRIEILRDHRPEYISAGLLRSQPSWGNVASTEIPPPFRLVRVG